MTKLTTIFDIYEEYSQEEILNHITESKVYLDQGARLYATRVRPIDTVENQEFLLRLEKVFSSLPSGGSKRYHLVCGSLAFSLDYLMEHFDDKNIRSYANEIKLLNTTLRVLLNQNNIHQYQRLAEFFDLVLAIFENMFTNSEKINS